jgi:DNA-binding NtrC family response regulator
MNQMKEKILIVEDEFIVANDLKIMLEKAGYTVCGIAASVDKALELIESQKPDWTLLDIFLQGDKTGISLALQLKDMDIPFIYISANTNQATLEAAKATLPYGFMVKPFREKDLLVMLDIARYRHQQNKKYSYYGGLALQKQLTEILEQNEPLKDKLKQICTVLHTVVPFDFLWISKVGTSNHYKDLAVLKTAGNEYKLFNQEELLQTLSISAREFKSHPIPALSTTGQAVYTDYDFRKLKMDNFWVKSLSDYFGLASLLVSTLIHEDEKFQLVFFNNTPDCYNGGHTATFTHSGQNFSLLIDLIINGKASTAEAPAKIKGTGEDITSEDATERLQRTKNGIATPEFNGIIGSSPLLQGVFKKIALVAADDTSVLILGESGTGKERIAQSIHQLSPRKLKPLIVVNCAALPLSLIESELFGHEKGAFTGANEKRLGKFEQADGGSIFLDEIGELPLEAQVKLLRVLQEKEIERIGSNQTKKINVRIIAATNRNLEKEVAEGRFRLDLYYRLNVFPVELPALRQRKEDIPLLVNHFIAKFSKGKTRAATDISAGALDTLQKYDWPGNIRELEHMIERSMVLTEGATILEIDLPVATNSSGRPDHTTPGLKTMDEMEREHILYTLKLCKGKIYGPGGAAEMLNLPSTTLNSKIKRLGIRYEFEK